MGVRYGSLPFKEQIAFWRAKELVPTERWNDRVREQHDTAFTVAGAMQADLLSDLHQAVTKAIEQGTTLAEFTRDFEAIVAARGWTGWTGEDTISEGLHEVLARQTYPELLRALGREPAHWADIRAKGFSYPKTVGRFHALLQRLGLMDSDYVLKAHALTRLRYLDMTATPTELNGKLRDILAFLSQQDANLIALQLLAISEGRDFYE
ncbi:hypothetical protein [Methylomicrobium agile]|uniref:phage head morphogenesis protein n=1 Tax=Methylomicrobium agile TaxID=39774 RepID=UPI0004DFA511|nr:hypothetical protein [Methylomicrobium agile]